MKSRLAAIVAALALTMLLAAPALAVDINPGQIPTSSDSTSISQDCTAPHNAAPGTVDWHFVLNQSSTNNQTLTATFDNFGTVTVSPDKVTDTYVLQYDIVTGSPDTLRSASTSGTSGQLQLSSICNGGPPPDVPEAPASVLLLLTAALVGIGFLVFRMRGNRAAA
jgi:hypothetical protein